MIKAVIFDCFGVLTTSGFRVFLDKYYPEPSKDREVTQKLMAEQNLGKLTYNDFIRRLAEVSNLPEVTVKDYLDENKANEPLFDYIRKELKPKYKIGLLSNAGDNWLKELFDERDIKLFEEIVLSYEVGLIKPDPDIYLLAAKRLGLMPEECVVIDDNAGHCNGAREAGMKAIRYKEFSQMKGDLQKILSARTDN